MLFLSSNRLLVYLNYVQGKTCSFLYGQTPVLDVDKVYLGDITWAHSNRALVDDNDEGLPINFASHPIFPTAPCKLHFLVLALASLHGYAMYLALPCACRSELKYGYLTVVKAPSISSSRVIWNLARFGAFLSPICMATIFLVWWDCWVVVV